MERLWCAAGGLPMHYATHTVDSSDRNGTYYHGAACDKHLARIEARATFADVGLNLRADVREIPDSETQLTIWKAS